MATMATVDGFKVGDRVVRRGMVAPVGEIVQLIPAVEGRGYMDHKAFARVRWPRRGGRFTLSNIQPARLARIADEQEWRAAWRSYANCGGNDFDRGW